MSDVEKIVDVNWRRRKWAEEAAAKDRRAARQQEEAKKRARRYELYRTCALIFAMAAGCGVAAMALLGYEGARVGSLAALAVTVVLIFVAVAFDELREAER